MNSILTFRCVERLKGDSFWLPGNDEICSSLVYDLWCGIDWFQFAEYLVHATDGPITDDRKSLQSPPLLNVKYITRQENVGSCGESRTK